MLAFLTASSCVDRFGWMLVHSLWQFALLALVAIAFRRLLRHSSATTRYAALLAAIAVMVVLPVATWLSLWSADAPAVAARFGPIENPAHVSPTQYRDAAMALAGRPAASPVELAATPQAVERTPIDVSFSWLTVKRHVQPWLAEIVLVWLAGVLVVSFRPLLSWYTVRRLRTVGVSPLGGPVQGVLERTAKRLGLVRAVEGLQSTLVKTPVVLGCFRPVVLLPLCVVTGLPAVQLELILAHELAHIRRHDYLVNLLQTVVETLFFYHPAVWWLSRQIRNERENCCDDVAMATVGSRAEYGRALLAIEELRAAPTAFSLGARGGSLLARIQRVAGCEPVPSVVGGGSVLGAILVSVAIVGAATLNTAPAEKKPAADTGSDSKGDRSGNGPSAPRAITKPKTQPGKSAATGPSSVASGKATDRDAGVLHLVRGKITWIGTDRVPLMYDDYDKTFYISWGPHTVVLPKHEEGFRGFYGARTLPPGVGRMDSAGGDSASRRPATLAMPGAIDLPAYQLLLQPSVQQALNLSEQQRTRLQDISAKYWSERRKIAGKELDDMEATSQEELTVESEKAHYSAGMVRSDHLDAGNLGGSKSPFSKELVETLERQWSSTRKQIEEVLAPEQLRTLKDLTFRTFAFGSGVMFEPKVLEKLGVVKKQQDELWALELQLQKEKDRRLRRVTREKVAKMLAVLTPQQQAQLREQHSLDKHPETDCSMYPYPMLPSHMPDSGAAEDLGFSPEQRERVRKIVTAHWTSLGALQQEEQKLPLGGEKARKALGEKRRQEMAELRKQIEEELGLSREQREHARKIITAHWKSLVALQPEEQKLPLDDEKAFKAIGEKRRQEMANLRKQVEAVLTPQQWASCKEIAFQNQAVPGLRMAAHMAPAPNEMGLSAQQWKALREIEAQYFDKPEQIYRELTDKALAAFTPAQQEKLRAEVDRRGW